jgi:hypothetical protein
MKRLDVQSGAPHQRSATVVSEAEAAEWRRRALEALKTTFG